MSSKNHRSGGKFGGSHTTVTPVAGYLADMAVRETEVQKVIPSFIKSGLRTASGRRNVKFAQIRGGLLVQVRENTSHQELIVATTDISKTRLALARAARDKNISISFKKNP